MAVEPFHGRPAPLLLAGPTASGKSTVALLLARKLQGEIISVDSMQVYRGMDIGTAKPNREEQAAVAHHLIDVVDVCSPFDVAQWLNLAQAAAGQIQRKGRVPIFVGGTGLYFKALIEGLIPFPSSNSALRKELMTCPLEQLLSELESGDPQTHARIDRANPRRVIRAVEILRLGGSRGRSTKTPAINPPNFFALRRERDDLVRRINERVEAMFAGNLVEETRALLAVGLRENASAAQALGYKQVLEYLAGKRSLLETIELVKIKTRQFAKRQMTWFRHQHSPIWIDLNPEHSPETIAESIAARYSGRRRSGTNSEDPRGKT